MSTVTFAEVSVRVACEGDDVTVAEMFAALHAFNADLEPRFALGREWRSLLDSHLAAMRRTSAGVTLIAETNGAVVGMLMMESHTDSPLFAHRHWAEIVALYVEPDARGKGTAKRLIDAAREWSASKGFAETRLYVTATNVSARSLYRATGFRPLQEIWSATHDCDDVPTSAGNPRCVAAWGPGAVALAGHHHPLANGGDDALSGS